MKESKKSLDLLDLVLLVISAAFLYILVFQGFGFPSISDFWNILLRILTAVFIQLFFCRSKWPMVIRSLPLLATTAFSLWCVWLYLTSWTHTSFLTLAAEFLSPALSCAAVLLVYRMITRSPHLS